MRKMKRLGSFFIAMVLVLSLCYKPVTAETTKKANSHKVVIYIGQKKVLKQRGVNNKKSKFQVIGKKKLVKIHKNGKIEGKKAGTATVRASYKNKTYKWKVVVKKTYLKEQNLVLTVGEVRQLELMGTGIKNCQSLDENIVTVSKKGMIYALASGETKVIVTGKNKRKHTCNVVVGAEDVTTQKPGGTTQKPGETTQKPSGTTQKPSGTTQTPSGTTQKPEVTTQKPTGTTQRPEATTQKPAGTTQRPEVTTQKPAGTTQKPAGTTQKPEVTTRKLSGTTQKPAGTTQRPEVTTQKPAGTTQKPEVTTQKPSGTTQKPAGTTQKPAGTTQKPAGTTQKPAGTTQKPADTTQKPAGTTQKPADTTQKPAETTQKPEVTTQKPAGTTQTPAGTTQAPAPNSIEELKQEMKKMVMSIDFSTHDIARYHLKYNQKEKAWKALCKEDEEVAIMAECYGCMDLYTEQDDRGYLTTMRVRDMDREQNNIDTPELILKRYGEINRKLKEMISFVNAHPEMTQMDKVLYVHNYIEETSYYKGVGYIQYKAGSILGDGYGVCEGYAHAMEFVLSRMGINIMKISSNPMNHAWNYVEVDGNWYHVDACWDDRDDMDNIKHSYFIRSDESFQTNIPRPHYDWYYGSYGSPQPIKATSTKYDDWFVHDIVGRMIYQDGYWYYVKGNDVMKAKLDGSYNEKYKTVENATSTNLEEYIK